MRKKLKMIIPLVMVFSIIFSISAYAGGYVYDDAALFNSMEVSSLQAEAENLGSVTGWDVVVVTTDDAMGKTASAYADDFYDEMGGAENGILYLIDFDNGELYVSTSGETAKYMTDSRIDELFNETLDYAADGYFYNCISSQISVTETFYNAGIPMDTSDASVMVTVFIVALIVGIIAALTTVFSVKRSYGFKDIGEIYEYNSKSKVNLTVNSDRLVNSFVTTRVRPKPKNDSDGGGGSSMHTSSSGRSHGGGGRSF